MANIIVKGDERRIYEAQVAASFGVDATRASALQREQAETIAAKTREVCYENGIKRGTY